MCNNSSQVAIVKLCKKCENIVFRIHKITMPLYSAKNVQMSVPWQPFPYVVGIFMTSEKKKKLQNSGSLFSKGP